MSMTARPARVRAVQALDARAARDCRVAQAERGQDAEAGRLQQESGADRACSSALRSNISIACPARARKIAAACPAVP